MSPETDASAIDFGCDCGHSRICASGSFPVKLTEMFYEGSSGFI